MKIRLNLDTISMRQKPENYGALRNRLCNAEHIREIEPDRLIEDVKNGRAFTPAAMTGTSGQDWQSQQVICADIDNDEKDPKTGKKRCIKNPLKYYEALEAMARQNIQPYFMYYSFSNTKDWPRYRVVLVLDEPLTDPAEAEDLTSRFVNIFNDYREGCADTETIDNARIFLGSRPGCVECMNKALTPLATLRALPRPKTAETDQKAQEGQQPAQHGPRGELRDAIETFDLADYVRTTENVSEVWRGSKLYFVPCPLCKTGGDTNGGSFNVTGHQWHCFSRSHEGLKRGGSIIDYLMVRHNIDLPAAMSRFEQIIRPTASEDFATPPPAGEGSAPGSEAEAPAEAAQQPPQPTNEDLIDQFLQDIQTRRYEPMPTGIKDIDNAIGGGFIRQQLILLGAAPGMGKTSLAQWIFEGMAERGTPCIFLNLEMSREQILARTFSRFAARSGYTITPNTILQGYKWTDRQREIILSAAEEYKTKIAPRMTYNPEGSLTNLDDIMKYLEEAAQRAEAAGEPVPCVVLDYLQIVGGDPREDDAAIIKRAVGLLKGFAVKHNTIVFTIIANNRDSNKSGRATMESGRDTSALEYSADLQIVMTYTACLPKPNKSQDGEDEKPKKPEYLTEAEKKNVTLVIVKGRFGGAGKKVDLKFDGETMTYHQIAPRDFDFSGKTSSPDYVR